VVLLVLAVRLRTARLVVLAVQRQAATSIFRVAQVDQGFRFPVQTLSGLAVMVVPTQ
jgi:hypothetical protein